MPDFFIQHDVSLIGEKDGYIDMVGRVEMEADPELSGALAGASNASRGVMASGEQFIGTQKQIDEILGKFPSVTAVDME